MRLFPHAAGTQRRPPNSNNAITESCTCRHVCAVPMAAAAVAAAGLDQLCVMLNARVACLPVCHAVNHITHRHKVTGTRTSRNVLASQLKRAAERGRRQHPLALNANTSDATVLASTACPDSNGGAACWQARAQNGTTVYVFLQHQLQPRGRLARATRGRATPSASTQRPTQPEPGPCRSACACTQPWETTHNQRRRAAARMHAPPSTGRQERMCCWERKQRGNSRLAGCCIIIAATPGTAFQRPTICMLR